MKEPANDNEQLAPWIHRMFYGGVNDNSYARPV